MKTEENIKELLKRNFEAELGIHRLSLDQRNTAGKITRKSALLNKGSLQEMDILTGHLDHDFETIVEVKKIAGNGAVHPPST
ncbi:MAG: hypothetical protein PVG99_13615 [Desulfobacteraceae bacterium]|jgi:hypothetical protein